MPTFPIVCSQCNNEGIVYAIKAKSKDRFVFRCFCSHAQYKKENIPVWKCPTPGFELEYPHIPKKIEKDLFDE